MYSSLAGSITSRVLPRRVREAERRLQLWRLRYGRERRCGSGGDPGLKCAEEAASEEVREEKDHEEDQRDAAPAQVHDRPAEVQDQGQARDRISEGSSSATDDPPACQGDGDYWDRRQKHLDDDA